MILQPSLVYTSGCYGGTSLFRYLSALPWFIPLIGDGSQQFQPIHMDDLTKVVVNCTKREGKICRVLKIVGYDFFDLWLVLTYLGYAITGACWLPVVWIQIQLRSIAVRTLKNNEQLPAQYYKLFNLWFYLGWPAFISLVIIFFLMVFKPM
ncbi:DUF2269 family protein [Candidatus Tisiphia endosymbiont of Empis tessellata]|uniref:DUF2269 family protein n=1 Tax=Candidatus Tisiphia endosymbiont of Empis tessellata TaxID=3066259 RepID=UPI00313AD33A